MIYTILGYILVISIVIIILQFQIMNIKDDIKLLKEKK